jgi:DNA-binding SARP family transcriptional activator
VARRELWAAVFWPEADNPEGRAALRRTLSALNTALEGGLDAQRDCVGLLAEHVELDVARFRRQIANARQHPAAGGALRASPAFDNWQFRQN